MLLIEMFTDAETVGQCDCYVIAGAAKQAVREIERLRTDRDAWKKLVNDAERAIGMDSVAVSPEARSLVEWCHEKLGEVQRLKTIITENLEYSADGVLLCNYDGPLYCPKCGEEVEDGVDLCYCWNCKNPDGGNEVPLPLSYLSCLVAKPSGVGE